MVVLQQVSLSHRFNIARSRQAIQVACSIMSSGGPSVQAESITCLQQLHMFAPKHTDLGQLVPELVSLLTSPHLSLRRSAVSCLRQLAQRDAVVVCELTSDITVNSVKVGYK